MKTGISVHISCKTFDGLVNVTLQYNLIGDEQWTVPPSINDDRATQYDQEFTINTLTKVDEGYYRCRAMKDITAHYLLLGFLGFGKFIYIFLCVDSLLYVCNKIIILHNLPKIFS